MDLAHSGDDFQRRNALRPPAAVLIPGFLVALYAWTILFTTIPYPGRIGLDYNTLGTDWMVFYGAIRSVLDGNAALIFDGDRFTHFLNTAFAPLLSSPLDFRPWAYPPSFLVMLLPFAGLGFFGSYVAFQMATGALLARALLSSTPVPLAISSDSLQTLDERTVVFAQTQEGFEPRAVQLGRSDGETTEVLAGLEPGETYATKNSFIFKAELGKGEAEHGH